MRFTFLILLLSLLIQRVHGQGCSDAGACSAGSLSLKNESTAEPDLQLGYSQTFGLADKESLVLNSELFVSHQLFSTTSLEFRIPYQITFGKLATTSGVGDLLVTLSQEMMEKKSSALTLVLSGRLKTNNSSKKTGDQPLPMVYQSSLGTNDIIAGLAWQSKKWSFSLAYQHPFGSNQNEYLHPDSIDLPERKLYNESAFLKRGDDLMVRIQRTLVLNESSTIRFGFLPIFRLREDQVKRGGVYESLPGSSGITYNLFFNWHRNLNENTLLTLTTGFPVHARAYRADGLTRTAVIGAGLIFRFYKKDKEISPMNNLFDQLEQD